MSHKREEKKVILLTGVTGGIGSVTAELLHKKGFKVYGTTRNVQNASETSYEIIELDVTKDESVKKCVDHIMSKEGKIDVLINNAADAICGAISYLTTKNFQDQFETNFFGPHRMIEKILPSMLERGEGQIINFGTLGGRAGMPYQGPYSATKAAIAIPNLHYMEF